MAESGADDCGQAVDAAEESRRFRLAKRLRLSSPRDWQRARVKIFEGLLLGQVPAPAGAVCRGLITDMEAAAERRAELEGQRAALEAMRRELDELKAQIGGTK